MKAPVDMLDMYVSTQQFELQRVDYAAATADGRVGGVQAGFPLWSGVWTLSRMPADNSDEYRAWILGLRGATRRFYGRDIARPFPKLYPDGFGDFGAFDGTAASWSETITTDDDSQVELDLGTDAAGLVLSQGDGIGFSWTATETAVAGLTWHAMVRVVTGGTADASGVVTVTSEPAIPTAVPSDATAYLNSPKCVMALVPDQSSLQAIDRLYSITGGQIVGIQDIRS